MEWTEERISRLKKLWTDGKSASQIAVAFGDITRNAVIGKVHRLGLSSRPSPIRKQTAPAAPRPVPMAQRQARVGEKQCHWPIGHPGETGFHFCGGLAEPDRPYCAEHCAMAYRRSDSPAA